MKVCTNELLLLGGIYQISAFIISMFTSEVAYAANGVLYILFWLAVLAIALNWVPKFVHQMNEHFPRLSVFMAYIGWIPYFTVLYALLSLGVDTIVSGSDSVTVFLNNYMPIYDIYTYAIILSIIFAGYKVFYKKEDLMMDCYLPQR